MHMRSGRKANFLNARAFMTPRSRWHIQPGNMPPEYPECARIQDGWAMEGGRPEHARILDIQDARAAP